MDILLLLYLPLITMLEYAGRWWVSIRTVDLYYPEKEVARSYLKFITIGGIISLLLLVSNITLWLLLSYVLSTRRGAHILGCDDFGILVVLLFLGMVCVAISWLVPESKFRSLHLYILISIENLVYYWFWAFYLGSNWIFIVLPSLIQLTTVAARFYLLRNSPDSTKCEGTTQV
jgi:hypothetical protein